MWYIGQKIVAVKTGSLFKEGDIFIIKSSQDSNCDCKGFDIDIGLKGSKGFSLCNKCGRHGIPNNGIWWIHERNFAPLDEIQAHESAVNELLQELNLQIQ